MLSIDIHGRVGAFPINAAFESAGGVTALFGRSGCGKSSIVNMIAGLVRPKSGRILLGDRVLFDSEAGIDVPTRQRRLGHVFQESRLFPHFSVKRNLTYGRWAGGRKDARTLDEVVELLGLEELLERRPHTLSGGERQRVAIGRALLAAPDILLMDEPLASLDTARKAEILPYLERLRFDAGIPIVYVSHAIDEVARLAETLVVVNKGEVAAAGPVGDILTRLDLGPATGRHEASSLIEGKVTGVVDDWELTEIAVGALTMRLPQVVAPKGSRIRLRVRARDVAIALKAPEQTSFQNVLPAKLREIGAPDGPYTELVLDVEGQRLRARVTKRSVFELDLSVGVEVVALVKSIAFDRRLVGSPTP